jgi:toxin-antitoxin system PIN domain toxin
MRSLLDVNVIIALFDPDHTLHNKAHEWWATNSGSGWASCPISENGVVRIMANPAYSKQVHFSPGDLIGRLRKFASQTDHEFWPEDISLRDEKIFVEERLLNSRQLTDIFLLAVAAKHHGRLVTFDQNISLSTVRIAKPENLVVL